ncbi:MAG: HEAT repeat domain-containing protein [Phycisphaerae bacterium]|nr:hypothetical protein [Phycisphaerae bacterium]NUQ45889.1 HEAT repeat domain-containing protein [Phycisphaerae bacterium]
MDCLGQIATILYCALAQSAHGSAPASQPVATSRPATATHSAPAVDPAHVERLILQLGDKDYHVRRAAHDALVALGDAAVDALLAHLSDPDHEIAGRVSAILPTPADPELRALVAIRLMETGRLDLLRKAIDILFDDPESAIKAFRERSGEAAAHAYVRLLAPDIVRTMEDWIGFAQIGRRLIQSAEARGDADGVAQQKSNIEEQRRSLKTVAYLYSEATLVEHLTGRRDSGAEASTISTSQPKKSEVRNAPP